jgi:Fe-S-cluster-containing hydrogenase component 2
MDKVILVRCDDCAQASCLVECGEDAIVNVAGDILVDCVKCAECGGDSGELPSCVAGCDKSLTKTLRSGSEAEKRKRTADRYRIV